MTGDLFRLRLQRTQEVVGAFAVVAFTERLNTFLVVRYPGRTFDFRQTRSCFWMFLVRTKNDLKRTTNFLDHI